MVEPKVLRIICLGIKQLPTYDGLSENWFLKSNRFDILSNLWNKECIELMPNLGEARLIPLNKVYPNIP